MEMTTPDANQLALFRESNPLRERFGASFLKQIPAQPGVYWMLDQNRDVIYVGKAKNLRARLRSYHATSRDKLAAKTWRLALKTQEIRWQVTSTETDALLLENRLLREIKPVFNVLNTRPETYLYVGHGASPEGLELRLIFSLDEVSREEGHETLEIHGAFKGLTRLTRAFAAIARWSWAFLCFDTAWPHPLAKKTAPKHILIPSRDSERVKLCSQSLSLALAGVKAFPELLLPSEEPEAFLQQAWLDDQLLLKVFFERNCTRLRYLKKSFNRESRLILQHELDDFEVLA